MASAITDVFPSVRHHKESFFAIRQEVHLSVAASVISPLTGLGCFVVLLLISESGDYGLPVLFKAFNSRQ